MAKSGDNNMLWYTVNQLQCILYLILFFFFAVLRKKKALTSIGTLNSVLDACNKMYSLKSCRVCLFRAQVLLVGEYSVLRSLDEVFTKHFAPFSFF